MPTSARLILLALAGVLALAAAVSPWFGQLGLTNRSQRLGNRYLILCAIVLASVVWASDGHAAGWARLARGTWMASLLLFAVSVSIRTAAGLRGERRM